MCKRARGLISYYYHHRITLTVSMYVYYNEHNVSLIFSAYIYLFIFYLDQVRDAINKVGMRDINL